MIAFVYRLGTCKDLANDLAYSLVVDIVNDIATVLVCECFESTCCSILAGTATATPIGPAVVNFVDSA
jgi:hypothetical protein